MNDDDILHHITGRLEWVRRVTETLANGTTVHAVTAQLRQEWPGLDATPICCMRVFPEDELDQAVALTLDMLPMVRSLVTLSGGGLACGQDGVPFLIGLRHWRLAGELAESRSAEILAALSIARISESARGHA